ncbi:MAG: hypothetical protein ACKVP7_12075 [Hyphomicrobiaceae bacterium]
MIFFDKDLQRADLIAEEFDNSIRPVTVPVTLSNSVPQHYSREIPSIKNSDVSKGFEGYSFTSFDITNYLASRCPSLPVMLGVSNENHPRMSLRFPRELTATEMALVQKTISELMPGWPYDIVVAAGSQDRAPALPNDALQITAAKLRAAAPAFVARDEEYFWSNIDAIFEGRHQVRDHASISGIGMSCYVDASVFPNVDLRQLLLLYDTILLCPPISDGLKSPFWDSQVLTKADLLLLIDAGRLRLILRQPEERTDLRWLEEVYERSPKAIIGRLSAAALLATDLVTTANEYTFSAAEHRQAVTTLARSLASELGVPERETLDLLLWPIGARLQSPQPLLDKGLMCQLSLGIGQVLATQINRETGKDVLLEAIATADGVHVSHVLSSTLIAPMDGLQGWHPAREAIAQRLNFYRSCNTNIAASWAVNERRKESRKAMLPPLPLFSFPKHASLNDILALSTRGSVRYSGRALISRLADLTVDERVEEIERLEKELYAHQMRRERRTLNIDTTDAAIGVANDVLSFGLWPVMSGLKLFERLVSIARRNPAFDTFADILERDIGGQFGRNSDIEFLDKVNRVAVIQS